VTDPFVHLHVASGYSLRHGASHPHQLVARAAEHGMEALALTDRDGMYGAVKFAQACMKAGIRPLFGVDLAVEKPLPRKQRSPARGGAFDPTDALPRVTFLARDGKGWAALCRLVSATHLAGERGSPITTIELVSEYAGGGGVIALLGPGSELGRALRNRRLDEAKQQLDRWRDALGPDAVVVEVVHHRGEGDVGRAARMLGFAHENGARAVLANVVRYADRADAPTADVLDASRRLVALDERHVDRRNAEAALLSGKEMAEVAEEVARAVGEDPQRLLAATRHEADRCAVDPKRDLGIGEVHFPELEVPGEPSALLRKRVEAGFGRRGMKVDSLTRRRLDDELAVIDQLGFPSYFWTVADVVDLIRDMNVRVAARGSGAGSLVNYLLGISDVDPIRYGLLMERFLSPLRHALPDIDVDVESARRTEVYERILEKYGGDRCTCVSMMDTYRARHGVRDVGAALGMNPGEIDVLAKAFPHIRASQVRQAMKDLPELRNSRFKGVDLLLSLVERLDGLPRHIALHPCGVLLSDRTLLDRTPVESSWLGFPMSQFDKDDVEALGLLKLDVLGIRMQSAMAHAINEVERVDGESVDLDAVARDDKQTFELVQSTKTLGCFQIESPGQRELVGKFGPETFEDLITDISLFRPGPVKSDMIRPFLNARQGWNEATYLHEDLRPALEQTEGVIVFHEQVLMVVSVLTGCTLAEADEVRRTLGAPEGQEEVKAWYFPAALAKGYPMTVIEQMWEVLEAFASFGFCKAHAAAFALPTYQSAWLKAHHPAAFLAGVLTHDPGMYPKRLILDDARQFGISVLGLDVNASMPSYTVEKVGFLDEPPPAILGAPPRSRATDLRLPDGRGYGIRIALSDVKGITDAEVERITAGRPFGSLSDFWHRAAVSRPVVERLVVAGGFDSLYGLGSTLPVRRRGQVTRRDLLLQVAELDRWSRAVRRAQPKRKRAAAVRVTDLADVAGRQAKQSQAAAEVRPVDMQLALDLGDAPAETVSSGLPEMTATERTQAELEVLGLDVSGHVLDAYRLLLRDLGVVQARDLLGCRNGQPVLVAGVKVATQTPPVRSGRRVVFVTVDDSTGPVDATFFEDAQVGYATTVFHSWLLVIHGEVRRTGPRGISLLAKGAWELSSLQAAYSYGGIAAVHDILDAPVVLEGAVGGGAHVYSTGFRANPYADIKPAGDGVPSRKLWHASPGSAGR